MDIDHRCMRVCQSIFFRFFLPDFQGKGKGKEKEWVFSFMLHRYQKPTLWWLNVNFNVNWSLLSIPKPPMAQQVNWFWVVFTTAIWHPICSRSTRSKSILLMKMTWRERNGVNPWLRSPLFLSPISVFVVFLSFFLSFFLFWERGNRGRGGKFWG